MKETYAERIKNKIQDKLYPCEIQLTDESHKHQGHSGEHPLGETHFALTIISEKFEGMNRIQRHQLVYGVLKDELDERVHALRLQTRTPEENKSGR